MNVDTVFIRGLRVETVIGVYEWERSIRQTLVFDLDMAHDIAPAAASDDIAQALDYHAVSVRVAELVQSRQPELIETLAEEVSAMIMSEFSVPWLRLRITKPTALAQADGVGVLIERGERRVEGDR